MELPDGEKFNKLINPAYQREISRAEKDSQEIESHILEALDYLAQELSRVEMDSEYLRELKADNDESLEKKGVEAELVKAESLISEIKQYISDLTSLNVDVTKFIEKINILQRRFNSVLLKLNPEQSQ